MKKEILIIALFLLVSGCAQEVVQEEDIAEIPETVEQEEIETAPEESEEVPEAELEPEEVAEITMPPMPEGMEGMFPEGMHPEDMMPEGMDYDEMMEMMQRMMEERGGQEGGGQYPSVMYDLENEGIPQFVEKNFIDLDKIKRISKFRGGYGHDFSARTGETCRSMKHYMWPAWGSPGEIHNPPWMGINYYAPVDGVIEEVDYIENDYGIESQFHIKSDEQPAFHFRFFHIKLLDSLEEGSQVTAGQHIGTIGDEKSNGEIAVEVILPGGTALLSFFQVMTDSLFEEYKDRGMLTREDAIISKEDRDANPLECDYSTEAGYFIGRGTASYDSWSTSPENWVTLEN
ncbi:M23 family metallopeptidase [Candidatus Woesearchaeota archaeon]|jgi:hypothetical protein|nr:M23 family metallopeptidase [Candidatus Woesearchaeota archaeon]